MTNTYADLSLKAAGRARDSRITAALAERERDPKTAERIRRISALQLQAAHEYRRLADKALADLLGA